MLKALFMLAVYAFLTHMLIAQQAAHNDTVQTHLLRAQQLLAEKKPDLAIKEYQAVLATRPDNVEAQANLGIVLFFHDECPQAIGHLDRALKLQPKLAKIQALLGVCQEREGQSDEAKRNLEASLPSVKETTIRILIEKKLVEVYYAEGNLQLASRVTDDLLGMDPQDPDVLYMVYRIHMDIADRARDTLAATALVLRECTR